VDALPGRPADTQDRSVLINDQCSKDVALCGSSAKISVFAPNLGAKVFEDT
jgi:hypothetical protein